MLTTPQTPVPEVHLLSNGRYHVMVTNAGGGSSRWKDFAITRWREDATCDNWGTFCYLRDIASGQFWSTAYQPTLRQTDYYEAIFTEGRAEFRRRDLDIETHTEIVVSPEDDIELRRVRITNRGRTRRTIEITSYAEVVLAPAAADALHSTFSNLFVQTEIIARAIGHSVHTPATFARRAHANIVSSDDCARRRRRRRFVRDRPRALHRARRHPGGAARDARARRAVGLARVGARSDRSDSPAHYARRRRRGNRRRRARALAIRATRCWG